MQEREKSKIHGDFVFAATYVIAREAIGENEDREEQIIFCLYFLFSRLKATIYGSQNQIQPRHINHCHEIQQMIGEQTNRFHGDMYRSRVASFQLFLSNDNEWISCDDCFDGRSFNSFRCCLTPVRYDQKEILRLLELASFASDQSMAQLSFIQENPNNCRCADCDAERPTVAIVSWLLVICQQCAGE